MDTNQSSQHWQGPDRRHSPYNNTPYHCLHESKIARFEADLDTVDTRLKEGTHKFEQLLVKLDQMTAQVPVIHERQDQYKEDFGKLITRFDQLDHKILSRMDSMEKETDLSIRTLDEKFTNQLNASLIRVHDRLDLQEKEHSKLSKYFFRALYIGTGLWLAISFAFTQVQPLKKIEALFERMDSVERNTVEIKDWVFKLQNEALVRKGK